MGLAVDQAGRVYVADAGSGFVNKFEPDGRPLLAFQDVRLESPDWITVNRDGIIYVTYPVSGRVIIFTPEGSRFREIRCCPRRGEKGFLEVVTDEEDNIFVLESVRHIIHKFDTRGRLAKAWNAPVSDQGPVSSAAHIAIGADGFLYVADANSRSIQKFTRDGEIVASFAAPSSGGVLSGLAVSDKYVFAADPDAHSVLVWTVDGQFKLAENLENRLAALQDTPYALAVSPRRELLLLDPAGPHVLRFRINF